MIIVSDPCAVSKKASQLGIQGNSKEILIFFLLRNVPHILGMKDADSTNEPSYVASSS